MDLKSILANLTQRLRQVPNWFVNFDMKSRSRCPFGSQVAFPSFIITKQQLLGTRWTWNFRKQWKKSKNRLCPTTEYRFRLTETVRKWVNCRSFLRRNAVHWSVKLFNHTCFLKFKNPLRYLSDDLPKTALVASTGQTGFYFTYDGQVSRARDPTGLARDNALVMTCIGGLRRKEVERKRTSICYYRDIVVIFDTFVVLSPSDYVGVGGERWQEAAETWVLTAFDSNVMKTFSESWRRESKNALDC